MNTTSDTPRTGAELTRFDDRPMSDMEFVDAEFARIIERELNAANERIKQWHNALTPLMPSDFKCWHENNPNEWPEVAAWVITSQRERIKRLEEALECVVPNCNYLHHEKKHRHKSSEPCPAEGLILKAREAKP